MSGASSCPAVEFPPKGGWESDSRSEGAGADSLPCLFSNNSNEEEGEARVNLLTGGHKRTAFVLSEEIQRLAREVGIEKLGFLTFTFADHVTSISEAQRRFNSLNTGVLRKRYGKIIGVVERQDSGRLHFHLVVTLEDDIRTGFDFAAIKKKDYRSAGEAIRREWAFWRKTAPAYGFGRTELLPVKSTAEGIARYVGGYISKHVGQRVEADKGSRMVRFIGFTPGERRFNSRFAWLTNNSWLWRQKVASFAKRHGVECIAELSNIFGRRWAWVLYETIMAEMIETRPEMSEERASLVRVDRCTILFRRVEVDEKKPAPSTSVCYALQAHRRKFVPLSATESAGPLVRSWKVWVTARDEGGAFYVDTVDASSREEACDDVVSRALWANPGKILPVLVRAVPGAVRPVRTKRGDSAATALAIPPRLGQRSFSMPGLDVESDSVDRLGFPIVNDYPNVQEPSPVQVRLRAYEHVHRRIPIC